MNITLVRPPFYALFGVATPKMKTYPLNLLYLATYVRERGGHVASVIDGENIAIPDLLPPPGSDDDPEIVMHRGIGRMIDVLNDPDHQLWIELENRIAETDPDLVGFTCNSGNMDTVRLMTKRLKRRGLKVALGGSHPTAAPVQSLEYTSADVAAVGEGEETLCALLNALEKGASLESIPGLAVRLGPDIRVNPRRPLIANIDDIPIPDRSLVPRADYFGNVLITGRGCPFNCAYCASRTLWGRQVRLRSVDSIIAELKSLETARLIREPFPGRNVVKIVDDTFTVSKSRTMKLLDRIIQSGLHCFEYTAGVRADTLDEVLVQKLKEANFRRVTLGVESGSPRILKMIRKGETNDDVRRAMHLLRTVGIRSHAFFMIGLPEERPEDIELSKRLILEARPDYVEINMVTPYPGTDIFDKLIPEGVDKIDRWYRWFHQGLATHSNQLGYDLDKAYADFLEFARAYNTSQTLRDQ
ncbi:MAG: B12-binding domain-containing radical SAM protein [Desulfomonilaceae bacterium]